MAQDPLIILTGRADPQSTEGALGRLDKFRGGEGNVAREDVPDLIVFSDMQFDQAHEGAWETHHERLQRTWSEKGYDLPSITYWNLRGDTQGGFMADAKTPGVRLLSGFSPALLKLVLTGEEVDEDEEVTVDGVSRAKLTPYQM